MRVASLVATLLVAACASAPGPVSGPGERLYAGAEPAARGGGDERQVRMTLKPGGEASVQATFFGAERRFFGEGRWQEEGDRMVVELAGNPPQRLVFGRSGEQLVAREWDRTLWGDKVPVLYRVFRR